jgi:drug/metabolite transporter (DMT)-like permease
MSWRDTMVFAFLGVANNALYLGFGYTGLKTASVGLGSLIVGANPVFTSILAAAFLGELMFSDGGDIVPSVGLFDAFAFLVLRGSILANLLWLHLLKVCGTSAASAYHFLVPPFGMFFTWIVLGEHVLRSRRRLRPHKGVSHELDYPNQLGAPEREAYSLW